MTDWNSQPWKTRLIKAQAVARASAAAPVFQKVVEQVIASGVSPSEVKLFLAEHDDVFGDNAEVARRAGEALLDQGTPKTQTPAAPGVKAHAVRLAGLPWFQRVSLPQPVVQLKGKGDVVVVDGQSFSPSDIAGLLRLA